MGKIKAWIDNNIDRKQMYTIIAATAAVGGAVYVARKAGMRDVATVVKGG